MNKKTCFIRTISFWFFFLFITTRVSAQDSTNTIESHPFVLGKIETIHSTVLSEKRIVNIYLPPGYNTSDSIRYPVIYLLDGSADEDFIHIAGLLQFLNFSWINIAPPAVLVGIANVDRKRDFTFPTSIKKDVEAFPTAGKSENFIQFIEKELQPYIEGRYKTTSDKTIIGQSLGGLLATEILYKKPALFTRYMIISPSLWWDNESLLKTKLNLQTLPGKETVKVFIAVGKEGPIMENDAKKLLNILKGQPKKINVSFAYFSNENHASIMHNALYKGFEIIHAATQKKLK